MSKTTPAAIMVHSDRNSNTPSVSAALLEELIEEILLRFPPDEPASLFLASLVCKPWCRLISGPPFRRRYRKFHRTPPLLGFLCDVCTSDGPISRFVSTSSCPPLADHNCHLVDARHGRVLMHCIGGPGKENVLVVWDPITDDKREILFPKLLLTVYTWNAAVVCAATTGGACDHLDCSRGAFFVVYVVSYSAGTFIWTYSSDAGSWSNPISTPKHQDYVRFLFPSVLVRNALYFEFMRMETVLKYDLENHELSVVGRPSSFRQCSGVYGAMDNGCLGFATFHKSKLCMWSRKHGPEANAIWTLDRVIELEAMLSSNAILNDPVLFGFVDWTGVILLRADNALFTVDLMTPEPSAKLFPI